MSGSRFASIKKSVPDEFSLGATVTEDQAADLARSASFDVLEKEAHSDSPATEFAAVSGLRPRSEAPAVGEVHSGIAAGEAKSEWKERCPGLGLRWREIPAEHRVNAWEHLRDWVQWFVLTYEIPLSKIPPCWFAHPAAVEELWIAFNAEVKVWEEGNPSTLPMTAWATFVPGIVQRLSGIQSMNSCDKNTHVGPEEFEVGKHPLQRIVDESLWAQYVGGDIKVRELSSGRWRVSVVGNQGQVSDFREVQVDELAGVSEVGLGKVYWQRNGAGGLEVRAHGFGQDAAGVLWEKLDEGSGRWVSGETDIDALPARDAGFDEVAFDEVLNDKLADLMGGEG